MATADDEEFVNTFFENMESSTDQEFMKWWFNSVELIWFLACSIILLVAIRHICCKNNQSNEDVDYIVKMLSLTSILLYLLSCITYTLSRNINFDVCFVLTHFIWAVATILSYLLFARQLYIIYNKRSNTHPISKPLYYVYFILVIMFACFQFIKSILIIFLNNEYISGNEYGKISQITIYCSAFIDLSITCGLLYSFNSRLSKSMKTPNKIQHHLINIDNVRAQYTILSTFGILTTQLYLIIWSVAAFIIYNYKGQNKDQHIYNITITAPTFRAVASITNSCVILLNFQFASKYYQKYCHLCLLCFSKYYSQSVMSTLSIPNVVESHLSTHPNVDHHLFDIEYETDSTSSSGTNFIQTGDTTTHTSNSTKYSGVNSSAHAICKN
eukprot:554905_1